MNLILESKGLSTINQSTKLYKIVARPQLAFNDLLSIENVATYISENNIDKEVIEQVEIHLKYSGNIEKEKNNTDKLNRLENIPIPSSFDYNKVKSLSYDSREK